MASDTDTAMRLYAAIASPCEYCGGRGCHSVPEHHPSCDGSCALCPVEGLEQCDCDGPKVEALALAISAARREGWRAGREAMQHLEALARAVCDSIPAEYEGPQAERHAHALNALADAIRALPEPGPEGGE